ncbi:substrate-binding and VWA domain-containing protein [Spirillospora sp. CA-253888]
MSGQQRNDRPWEPPEEGGHDPSTPIFGPAIDGSSNWFGAPDAQDPAALRETGWSGERAAGFGGFTGASDASGSYPTLSPREGAEGRRDARDGSGAHERSGSHRGSGPRDSSESPGGSGAYAYGGSGSYGGSGAYGGSGSYEGSGGRRRKAKQRRSRMALLGPLAGAAALALLLGGGVYAFAAAGEGCSGDGGLVLDVAAAPDIAPAVEKAAARFAGREVDGRCVHVKVRATAPAAVASLLSGESLPSAANRRPDVWIPDSGWWAARAVPSPEAGRKVAPFEVTGTSLARSPLVLATPRSAEVRLPDTSWGGLLKAAATAPEDRPARLVVPDPARDSAGVGVMLAADATLAGEREKASLFTGVARAVRESSVPTADAPFERFSAGGRPPVVVTTERAVWRFNRSGPAEPASVVYPRGGTLSLDYPFTVPATGADRRAAARAFERSLGSEAAREDVRALGLRSPDGRAPAASDAAGLREGRPQAMAEPADADVRRVTQAWFRLSLGIRMLSLLDVSGTMGDPIAPGTTRLQATARTAQAGMSLMADDTELGQWIFSTELDGDRDWREMVPVGPLGERIGSATRRQLILSALGSTRPKKDGNTGLFETLTAAYEHMTETYKPEFGNTVLLLTDGKGNDDPGGPSLAATLKKLKRTGDPNRPVQVVMIGIGKNVDTRELKEIAKVTPGSVYVAETPEQISRIFLQALSRRISR